MNYYLRLIPLLVFLIPFVKSLKQKNEIAMVITGLFLVSSICSLFIDSDVLPLHNFESDNISTFFLYSFLLLPFLWISLKIKPFLFVNELPKGPILNLFLIVLFLGAIYSLIYLTPYAISSLAVNATDIRTSGEGILPPNIFTTIAVGFPAFFYVYIFLFFACMIQKRSIILTIGMLLGVLAFVVNVFTISGRDGVFLSAVGMFLGYFLFKPLLLNKQRKRFMRVFITIGFISLIFILQITIERFGSGQGFNFGAFKKGIIGYLGMQPFVFSDWINKFYNFDYGYENFSIFLNLLGQPNKLVTANREIFTWQFGTFLTAFYQFSGYLSLILISFVFWIYFKTKIGRLGKYGAIARFFFLGLYFQFIVSGVFYFRLGNKGGNLFIIFSMLAVLLFRKKRFS